MELKILFISISGNSNTQCSFLNLQEVFEFKDNKPKLKIFRGYNGTLLFQRAGIYQCIRFTLGSTAGRYRHGISTMLAV